MYLKIVNEQPVAYSIAQLYRDNPRVSFPASPSAELLASYDVFSFTEGPRPAETREERFEPVFVLSEGAWTRTWVAVDKTSTEIEAWDAAIAAERLRERTSPDALLSALNVVVNAAAPNLDALDSDAVLKLAPLFDDWAPGKLYKVGDRLNYEGVVLKVVQQHTSQADWIPDALPALYTAYRPAGQVTPWVQPTGAQDAYAIGELVSHDNPNDGSAIWIYESKIDANTTEPGRDGTFDRWWQPVSKV